MNMGDEISTATVQVGMHAAEKSIDIAAKTASEIMDMIAKLLQALTAGLGIAGGKDKISKTDLTDIKPGEIGIKDLIQNAKKNGESIVTSEHGLTAADKKYISKKAKEYGIPVAFTGNEGKDNLYANVRKSDLPVLKRICTEMMKDKLAVRPQELGNFKVQEWEIPFIASELNKHDLSAQFGMTKSGEHVCLYEKADEKAILIARGEFVRKADEVKNEIAMDRDENGYLTIKDLRSGREISFDADAIPSREELSVQMQEKFGFDKNKADIACARFGEEQLEGADKQKFFSDNPQQSFSKVDTNITLEGESALVLPYTCWRITPKKDSVPRLVFQDENGKFAVLNPEKQTKKAMQEVLREQLSITDQKTLDALTDKAVKVTDYYNRLNTENLTDLRTFDETELLTQTPEELVTYVDADSNVHQKIPQSISSTIERSDKDSFLVTSTMEGMEYVHKFNGGTEDSPVSDQHTLVLSFSDKKNAVAELTAMYREQGVPDHIAKSMAQDVFKKAQTQSAEKVLHIQEVRQDAMTVAFGTVTREITTADKQAAASKIAAEFGVPSDTAEAIVEKAQEIKIDAVQKRMDAVQGEKTDFNTALNRITARDKIKLDSMVVCSAVNPERYIVVTGDHNGERVTHDYSLFNGQQQIGRFSDEHTTNAAGEPVTEANGKRAWTNLKEEMKAQLGMGNNVMTFESEQAYQEYMNDRELLMQLENDGASADVESPELITESTMDSNDHKKPELQAESDSTSVSAKSPELIAEPIKSGNGHEANLPEMEMPEMPVPKTRGRH